MCLWGVGVGTASCGGSPLPGTYCPVHIALYILPSMYVGEKKQLHVDCHVCPYARMPVCPYARMPVCPCARVPVCPYARMPVCPYARMPVCPCARMAFRGQGKGGTHSVLTGA